MIAELALPAVRFESVGLQFEFTADETAAMDAAMVRWDGVEIAAFIVERVHRGTKAVALSRYAQELLVEQFAVFNADPQALPAEA